MAGGMHDRGGMRGREGGMRDRRRAWQGACMAVGHTWQGEGCAWQGACMPQQILRDTVNERAVRILLECILVLNID